MGQEGIRWHVIGKLTGTSIKALKKSYQTSTMSMQRKALDGAFGGLIEAIDEEGNSAGDRVIPERKAEADAAAKSAAKGAGGRSQSMQSQGCIFEV